MFEKLQEKWKVSGWQLLAILCTFAIGGSLTGFLGKKVMNLFPLEKGVLWVIIYIVIITIIWPLTVLAVSVPFGQFSFFKNYITKLGRRMGIGREVGGRRPEDRRRKTEVEQTTDNRQQPIRTNDASFTIHHSSLTIRIAIFASGAGSNAQKIIDHFRNSTSVKIALIVCNKPEAGVLKIAATENIPFIIIEKEQFFRGNGYVDELKTASVDFIILAGFLWKIPTTLIKAFPGKIINIHPALLPAYGGKGMYGAKVHETVVAAGEKESGITIHYVDEIYDHGKIIFQAKCEVLPADTGETLAQRIHALEHLHFPVVIEQLLSK